MLNSPGAFVDVSLAAAASVAPGLGKRWKGQLMNIRGFGRRKLLKSVSWLWLTILCCLPGPGLSQSTGNVDDFDYQVGWDNGHAIMITGYTGPGGDVVIPSSLPITPQWYLPVLWIGDFAFRNCDSLDCVSIPEGVFSIGNGAFQGCDGLTSVTIPSTVAFIGANAFSGCSGLTGAYFQNGPPPSLATNAFEGASASFALYYPIWANGWTTPTWEGYPARPYDAPYNGFSYSVSGTNITITHYTGSGSEITIPSSLPGVNGAVTSIASGAFSYCSGLINVTIPTSGIAIGDRAFEGCALLSAVYFQGDAPTSIGSDAFYNTSASLSFYYPIWAAGWTTPTWDGYPTRPYFVPYNGLSFLVTGTNITITRYSGAGGTVAIPSSIPGVNGAVTSIGFAAFYQSTLVSRLTIPASVASIGTNAFLQCSSLTSAYFQGDAPSTFGSAVFDQTAAGFSIYYPSTASGWSTPTWNGYAAQPYNYAPPGQLPLLMLSLGAGTVTPSFSHLLIGTNYQLQISSDLNTWSDCGLVFAATNASEAYFQPLNATNWNRHFFRLLLSP